MGLDQSLNSEFETPTGSSGRPTAHHSIITSNLSPPSSYYTPHAVAPSTDFSIVEDEQNEFSDVERSLLQMDAINARAIHLLQLFSDNDSQHMSFIHAQQEATGILKLLK